MTDDASFNGVFGITLGMDRTLSKVLQVDESSKQPIVGDVMTSCVSADKTQLMIDYQVAVRLMARQAIAALQNSAGPVGFELSLAEVIDNFQRAYNGGDCDTEKVVRLTKTLYELNNRLCPQF